MHPAHTDVATLSGLDHAVPRPAYCEHDTPHRTADDHSGDCSGTKFYHWGALTGMITLVESVDARLEPMAHSAAALARQSAACGDIVAGRQSGSLPRAYLACCQGRLLRGHGLHLGPQR